METRDNRSQATVSLVALCFVAVLGIALASYIAVCSRAMNLSNRTFQRSLAQQLAEVGIEEGLRAFNRNDWSNWSSAPSNVTSSAWTLDAANKRATRTLSFSSGKLGQGTIASVKIRIDNYDAAHLGSAWATSRNYRTNDLVGYNGVWYRALADHASSSASAPGNLGYWAEAPIAWAWCKDTSYQLYDVVNHNGVWYRCKVANTNSAPANANWERIPLLSFSWSASTAYESGSFVYHAGTWYRYTGATGTTSEPPASSWSDAAPYISWSWRSISYKFNDVVYHNGTWYRCKVASSGTAAPPNSSWENALSGTNQGWISGVNYNLGDVVYSSSTNQWHRCLLAHTSSNSNAPGVTTTGYWTNTPRFDTAWSSSRLYNQYDVVRYNGVWFLSLQGNNSGRNPETDTTYWIGANTSSPSYAWSAAVGYTSASLPQSYGGVWYKCLIANTGESPNNTTFWTPSWKNGWQPNATDVMGAPVIYSEAAVSIAGSAPVKTQLRAAINPAPLFPNAIAAQGAVELNAGGTVASYSSVTSPIPTTSDLGYAAVIASNRSALPGVKVVGATVQGYVAAPAAPVYPGNPSVQFGSSATLRGAASSPSPKVDPSRVSRSPYIPQFSTLPSGTGGLASNFSTVPKGTLLPSASVVNLGSAGAPAPSRYYFSGDLVMGGGSSTIQTLNINGPVIIFISGNLTMWGGPNGIINLNDTGSAEIHIGGSFNVTAASDGVKNNASNPDPRKLTIICDTTGAATLSYGEGVQNFYGVIYAPNTTATNGLNFPNTATKVFGAISAAKVTFDNNATVYYDTSLRYESLPGVDQPYSVTDLRELPATQQATMP